MRAISTVLLAFACTALACNICHSNQVGAGKKFNVTLCPPSTFIAQFYLTGRGNLACICAENCAAYKGGGVCGATVASGDATAMPCFPTESGCNSGQVTCIFLTDTSDPPTVVVRTGDAPPASSANDGTKITFRSCSSDAKADCRFFSSRRSFLFGPSPLRTYRWLALSFMDR